MPVQVATPVRGILRLPHLADTGSTSNEPRVVFVDFSEVCHDCVRGDMDLLEIVESKHFVHFVLLRRLDDPTYKFDGQLEERQMFLNWSSNRADMLQAMSNAMDASTYMEVLEKLSVPSMVRLSPAEPDELQAELEKMIDEESSAERKKQDLKETLFEILKRKDTIDMAGTAQHAPPGAKSGGKGKGEVPDTDSIQEKEAGEFR